MTVTILRGDCRAVLRDLPERSVHAVVTSPPFWALREYLPNGHPQRDQEIGREPTIQAYVSAIADVFEEVRRVLRDDGCAFVELGDTYANDGKWGGSSGGTHALALHGQTGVGRLRRVTGLPPKSLVGIPWRVAFALQDRGWVLRSECIWHRPNANPEAVKDRPCRSHSTVFMLTKEPSYFYDAFAVLEDVTGGAKPRGVGVNPKARSARDGLVRQNNSFSSAVRNLVDKRNLRSVWSIPSKPSREAFYAAFPEELARRCISASTSEHGACSACGAPWTRVVERLRLRDGVPCDNIPAARNTDKHTVDRAQGIGHNRILTTRRSVGWKPGCECAADRTPSVVLDPFGGSGTVGRVANELGRHAILVELNPAYIEIAERRCAQESLFAQAVAT